MKPNEEPSAPSQLGADAAERRGLYARAGGLLLFLLLLFASWKIVAPFAVSLAWAVSLAVSVHPLQNRLARTLGGRKRLAAALMSLVLVVTVLLPVGLLLLYATQGVQALNAWVSALDLSKMTPPDWLERLPIAGPHFKELWLEAQHGDFSAFARIEAALGEVGSWLLEAGLAIGGSLVQVLLAMVLVFPLLLGADRGVITVRRLAEAVEPRRGRQLVEVATRVIRGVSLGVIGGAAIASLVLLAGLAIAGAPALGLLGVITFVLALVQAPIFLIGLAVGAWLWWQGAMGWAIFVAVWSVGVHFGYGVLQSVWISKEAGMPVSVMFVGVLGGFVAFGFIGLFIGPVVLGVLYATLTAWLQDLDRAPSDSRT
jgi:predicted PurR-regulated permease PerM